MKSTYYEITAVFGKEYFVIFYEFSTLHFIGVVVIVSDFQVKTQRSAFH